MKNSLRSRTSVAKNSATERGAPSWVPRSLYPFESRFIDLDGHSIHYIDEGAGPTILFVHGNPTWSFLYRDIVRQLKPQFRCIAVDHPGFGLSRAAEDYDFLPASHARVLDGFVAALGLTDFTIMVQDWGGPIGLWVAAKRADQVGGLVIGNTWAWPINGDKHFERFSAMMGGPVGGFFIRHFNAFVNLMIPTNVKRKRLPREVMKAYRGPFLTKDSRLPTRIFPREIRRSSAFLSEVEVGLEKLKSKPALIIWGDRDIAFRDKERARFEATFSNHRTVVLDGAGHYIQEAAPDEIAAAIRDWHAGLDRQGIGEHASAHNASSDSKRKKKTRDG
ncbi:MAG: alpha/beta fold hydrolase [Deltaproteobacteria bacterium]|nr:alpha/beta fold hydrolase [Deltaproteobacteria bacterium]